MNESQDSADDSSSIAVHTTELSRLLDPIPVPSSISGFASRIGHSVGLAMAKLPHVAEYDDTMLEPGMVITAEPGVATPYGTFRVEENVLPTEDAHRLLSTLPRGYGAFRSGR